MISYYFRVGAVSELTPSLSISDAKLGGYLDVTASAAGGAGGYRYAYQLLKNGVKVDETEWGTWTVYNFPITGAGTYRVRLYVKDSSGTTVTAESRATTVGDTTSRAISGRVLSEKGNAVSGVQVTFYIDGFSKAAATVTTKADGTFTWDARTDCRYQLDFFKYDVTFPDKSVYAEISNRDTNLGVINAIVAGENHMEVEKSVTLAGHVQMDNGSAYPFVNVVMKNENGAVISTTVTDKTGDYYFTLSSGAFGQNVVLSFEKDNAVFTPDRIRTNVSDRTRIDLQTVTASIPSVADTCSFTMNKTTIVKDDSVTFTITVPTTANAVRMYADGVNYPGDEVPVTNGKATMTRFFTSAHPNGVRITFAPVVNGVVGQQSAARVLTVTLKGTLAKPALTAPATVTLGDTYSFKVGSVANATGYMAELRAKTVGADDAAYTVVWYNNSFTPGSYVTIPASTFKSGYEYKLTVYAAASGYDGSSNEQLITVQKVDYGLKVNLVKDNSYNLLVETEHKVGYIRVAVTSPAGNVQYWPAAGAAPTAQSPAAPSFRLTSGGVWNVDVYLYTSQNADEDAYVDHYTGVMNVDGPTISAVLPYGMQWNWLTVEESKKFVVKTNSSVDQVEIRENGKLLGTFTNYSTDSNNGRSFTCDLPAATNIKHTYQAVGISGLTTATASLSKTFYVVLPISKTPPVHVYVKAASATLVQSPMNNTAVIGGYVQGGQNFDELTVIGDTEDWYQVCINNVEGFIPKNDVDSKPTTTGGKQLTITKPSNNNVISENYTTIDIDYKVNFVIDASDAANLFVTVKDRDTGSTVYNRSYMKPGVSFATTGSAVIDKANGGTLPAGRYQLQLAMKATDGTLLASDSKDFTIGNYSATDAYRAIWKDKLLTDYNRIVMTDQNSPTGGMMIGGFLFIWGNYIGNDDGINSAYMTYPTYPTGFSKINRAAAVAMVDMYNKSYYDKRVGNEASNYLMTDDKMQEMAIEQMIMKSCDENLSKRGTDYFTVSAVAAANNRINQRNSDHETIMKAAGAVKDLTFVIADGVEVYFAVKNDPIAKTIGDMKSNVKDFLDFMIDEVNAYTEAVIEHKNLNELIDAYVEDYVNTVLDICDDNINYLRYTYFGDSWSGNRV